MEPEAVARTHIHYSTDGTVHVQHYGAGHIIPESVQEIELKPGESIVIRHVSD